MLGAQNTDDVVMVENERKHFWSGAQYKSCRGTIVNSKQTGYPFIQIIYFIKSANATILFSVMKIKVSSNRPWVEKHTAFPNSVGVKSQGLIGRI